MAENFIEGITVVVARFSPFGQFGARFMDCTLYSAPSTGDFIATNRSAGLLRATGHHEWTQPAISVTHAKHVPK